MHACVHEAWWAGQVKTGLASERGPPGWWCLFACLLPYHSHAAAKRATSKASHGTGPQRISSRPSWMIRDDDALYRGAGGLAAMLSPA
jgi:hypothetical protein